LKKKVKRTVGKGVFGKKENALTELVGDNMRGNFFKVKVGD